MAKVYSQMIIFLYEFSIYLSKFLVAIEKQTEKIVAAERWIGTFEVFKFISEHVIRVGRSHVRERP